MLIRCYRIRSALSFKTSIGEADILSTLFGNGLSDRDNADKNDYQATKKVD